MYQEPHHTVKICQCQCQCQSQLGINCMHSRFRNNASEIELIDDLPKFSVGPWFESTITSDIKSRQIRDSIIVLFSQNGIVAKSGDFWAAWLSFLYDPDSGEIATLLDWETYKEKLSDTGNILPYQSEVIDMEFIDTYQCYQLPIIKNLSNIQKHWDIIPTKEVDALEWEHKHPEAIDLLDNLGY